MTIEIKETVPGALPDPLSDALPVSLSGGLFSALPRDLLFEFYEKYPQYAPKLASTCHFFSDDVQLYEFFYNWYLNDSSKRKFKSTTLVASDLHAEMVELKRQSKLFALSFLLNHKKESSDHSLSATFFSRSSLTLEQFQRQRFIFPFGLTPILREIIKIDPKALECLYEEKGGVYKQSYYAKKNAPGFSLVTLCAVLGDPIATKFCLKNGAVLKHDQFTVLEQFLRLPPTASYEYALSHTYPSYFASLDNTPHFYEWPNENDPRKDFIETLRVLIEMGGRLPENTDTYFINEWSYLLYLCETNDLINLKISTDNILFYMRTCEKKGNSNNQMSLHKFGSLSPFVLNIHDRNKKNKNAIAWVINYLKQHVKQVGDQNLSETYKFLQGFLIKNWPLDYANEPSPILIEQTSTSTISDILNTCKNYSCLIHFASIGPFFPHFEPNAQLNLETFMLIHQELILLKELGGKEFTFAKFWEAFYAHYNKNFNYIILRRKTWEVCGTSLLLSLNLGDYEAAQFCLNQGALLTFLTESVLHHFLSGEPCRILIWDRAFMTEHLNLAHYEENKKQNFLPLLRLLIKWGATLPIDADVSELNPLSLLAYWCEINALGKLEHLLTLPFFSSPTEETSVWINFITENAPPGANEAYNYLRSFSFGKDSLTLT